MSSLLSPQDFVAKWRQVAKSGPLPRSTLMIRADWWAPAAASMDPPARRGNRGTGCALLRLGNRSYQMSAPIVTSSRFCGDSVGDQAKDRRVNNEFGGRETTLPRR
jgi:hypothetical protein